MLFFLDAGNYNSRKVGRDETPHGFVSTVCVSDGVKPYETAVQDSRYAHPSTGADSMVIVENYDTIEEAKAGHAKWVAKMTGPREALPFNLIDCGNGLGGLSALIGDLADRQLLPEV